MSSDPSHQTQGTRTYDELRAGEFGFVTEEVTIASGHNISRGMCLGRNTSTGEWEPVDDAAADGTEVLRGVLAEDVDTSGGSAKKAVIYRNGVFNESVVAFGGDDTVSDHRTAAAEKGIYFKSVIND